MSFYDYKESLDIASHDYGFYALIMAAMRKADTNNKEKLMHAFPEQWKELNERYHSPGGLTKEERNATGSDRNVPN